MHNSNKARTIRLFVVIAMLVCTSVARAQYLQETGSPTFTTPESVPMGFVNVANGNLHLEIPLGAFPQRGGGSLVAKMVYDSRIWKIVDNGTSQSWQPTNIPGTPGLEQYLGWRFVITGAPNSAYDGPNAVYDTVIGGQCYSGTDLWTWYDYQNYRYYDTNGTARRFPLFYESSTPCHTGSTGTTSGPSMDATGYQMNRSYW